MQTPTAKVGIKMSVQNLDNRLDYGWITVALSAGEGKLFILKNVQTLSGTYIASCSLGTSNSVPEGKTAGPWSWYFHLMPRLWICRIYISVPSCGFMASIETLYFAHLTCNLTQLNPRPHDVKSIPKSPSLRHKSGSF
jgi:hypothetical protein